MCDKCIILHSMIESVIECECNLIKCAQTLTLGDLDI